jgi:hypothetical protein
VESNDVDVLLALLLIDAFSLSGPPPQQRAPSAALPVSLTLSIGGGQTRFHTGEIIPIELAFTSQIPNRFVLDSGTYDRSGRLTIDEFHVEPIDRVSDPLLDYFASAGGFIGGGIRGMPVLGERPEIVKLDLNEWFRFDKPGTFRVSVHSHRVRDDAAVGSGRHDALVVESNVVAFEIVPGDADWSAATVASALRMLDSSDAGADLRKACRMLRFLASDAAVDEMIARFDDGRGCEWEYMAGLFSAPHRDHVVQAMEAALARRDQPVSSRFLRTLAVLAIYLAHPEYRSPQTAVTKGQLPGPGELALVPDVIQEEIVKYQAIARASLPDKSGPARALTLADEFEAQRDSADELRHQLTLVFLNLPAPRQRRLLEYSWSRLRSPEILPALRTLVAKGPAVGEPFGEVALLRLYQLAPDEGRAVMLSEIAAPARGATLRTLGRLPDRELPSLDDRLASNVLSDDGDLSIRAELLQRYASAAVAPRVLAAVQDRLEGLACQPKAALLAYFLRVDPGQGALLLNEALAARQMTGCYQFVLLDVAKLRASPELESTAIAHLTDSDVGVVGNAIETLGRYGSPAAEAPLRAAFERWHAAWVGRADEVRPRLTGGRSQAAQSMVENHFLQSLALARGWVADKENVETLEELCLTDSCRDNAKGIIAQIGDGYISVVARSSEEADGLIAQYLIDSLPEFEQKLAQYSRGTRFRLKVSAPTPEIEASIRERIARPARARGIQID